MKNKLTIILERINNIIRLFFRGKLTICDFDTRTAAKAIEVLPIQRTAEIELFEFRRVSVWLFANKESGWSFDLLHNELD
jgi:hypothetical protein